MSERKNPLPTVDIIIEIERPDGKTGLVLIERKNPPPGWALSGKHEKKLHWRWS
jgi:8-oxo-dGTP diphosphatase